MLVSMMTKMYQIKSNICSSEDKYLPENAVIDKLIIVLGFYDAAIHAQTPEGLNPVKSFYIPNKYVVTYTAKSSQEGCK